MYLAGIIIKYGNKKKLFISSIEIKGLTAGNH